MNILLILLWEKLFKKRNTTEDQGEKKKKQFKIKKKLKQLKNMLMMLKMLRLSQSKNKYLMNL